LLISYEGYAATGDRRRESAEAAIARQNAAAKLGSDAPIPSAG
jgi:hypothetical protein